MDMADYDLALDPGFYRLQAGALHEDSADVTPRINLASPYLFVVDAAVKDAFLSWFHRVSQECNYRIPMVIERLGDAENTLGLRVGFYWEDDLANSSKEGIYHLDASKVISTP